MHLKLSENHWEEIWRWSFYSFFQNFDAVAKIIRSVFFPVSKAVFRTLSKMECFAKIANGLAVSYFCKMLHFTCFTEFWIYFSRDFSSQSMILCDKIFKNGPSKICGRQPLKNLKWYGLPIFHKFYLVHSWILCPI